MKKLNKRTTVAIGVTIPVPTKEIIDLMLTPPGFFEPPKGSYSQLISGLLNGYILSALNTDIYSVFSFKHNNPDCSFQDLLEEFTNGNSTTNDIEI
jgi:hypothetical protein